MKLNIIISVGLLSGAFFLSKSNTTAQEANLFVLRYIDVDRANAKEFEKAVAEKTKKFNRSEDSDQWFTHKILTGPRTGQPLAGPLLPRLLGTRHNSYLLWRGAGRV